MSSSGSSEWEDETSESERYDSEPESLASHPRAIPKPISLGKRKRESEQCDDSEPESPASPPRAISHAERRRQRRRQERKEGQPVGGQKTPSSSKQTNVVVSHRKNSVWVGNLSFKTTSEDLRRFFDGVGEIKRIHMPTRASTAVIEGRTKKPENRGFAYVDFSTEEEKRAAITRSEQPLIGRRLLIKDGDDFTGRPNTADQKGGGGEGNDIPTTSRSKSAQKILRAQKQRPAPTLFFGNLGFEATEQSIRELLEAHKPRDTKMPVEPNQKKGEWIRKVRMGTFEDSGLCKGFAFVDFTSVENATSALTNPKNHRLDGRTLVVEYASAEAVRRGGGGGLPRPVKPVKKGPHSERREEVGTKGKEKVVVNDRSRPKPGAALALAKRETVAIIPSRGQKITF